MNLAKNKDYKNLPQIKCGDMLNILDLDGLNTVIQCIVEGFKDNKILVIVRALFASPEMGQIYPSKNDELYGYEGKRLAIERENIQKVIKKNS